MESQVRDLESLPDFILFKIFDEILRDPLHLTLLDLGSSCKFLQAKVRLFLATNINRYLIDDFYYSLMMEDPSENQKVNNDFGCVPGFIRKTQFTPSCFEKSCYNLKDEFTSVMSFAQDW